jgi:hypothetical protein
MLRCLIAVPVVVVAIGLAAGCGGSSSGSASYLGRAPGLVLFLQWTRSGRSLTGSAEVAEMPATDSYDVSSDDLSFTGTINGDSVSLRFDSPVGGARTLTGHLHGKALDRSIPTESGALKDLQFSSSSTSGYNTARSTKGRSVSAQARGGDCQGAT